MTSMRVLLIHNHYQNLGGEDIVFKAERGLLLTFGHDIVTLTDTNHRIDQIGKFLSAKNAIWSQESTLRIEKVITQQHPDIAHVHNTWLMISPSIYYVFKKYRIPVVQTLHNYRIMCPAATLFRGQELCEDCIGKFIPTPGIYHACYHSSRSQTAVLSAMLVIHRLLQTWQKHVSLYLAPTEFSRNKFIQGGLPSKKIIIKPNFVDDFGVKKNLGNFALYVGRLSPEKGLRNMLKAWSGLQIPLKIVGDGPIRMEVEKEVKVSTNIEFLGGVSREKVFGLMKECRMLVFPSECFESFGMTIVEAFSCGVPVISSDIGSQAEIVKDGFSGLHFRAGDPDDLALKSYWLWNNPAESARMGRNARREYEEKYTPERNYQILMDIYQKAIDEKNYLKSMTKRR